MEMEIVAKLRYLRIAPRKVRLVADALRGKPALKARAELGFLGKAAAKPLAKLLNSALANARHNFNLPEESLYLAKILVDEGPKLKRWRPRSRGRAFPIQKKTSHVTFVLRSKQTDQGELAVRPPAGQRDKTKKLRTEKTVPSARPRFKEEKSRVTGSQAAKRFFRRKAF